MTTTTHTMFRHLPILLVGLLLAAPAASGEEVLDGVAAIVNDEVLTCYELDRAEASLRRRLRESGQTQIPEAEALRHRALESRIVHTLQLQEAERLDLEIEDEQLDQTISQIERRNRIPSGQFEEVLRRQGVDIEEYRRSLRERLLLNKLVNVAVRSKLSISEESMREYYRKYLKDPRPLREIRPAQIFLALPLDPTPEQVRRTRNRAQELYRRIQAGTPFAQLVALHSDAPEASKGGEMGWISEGAASPLFAPVMERPVGSVSPPLRTSAGFHIVKVLEERWRKPETRGESYDEVRARHILLKLPTDADAATEAKIRQRARRIAVEMEDASDEEFATRAEEISQGPSASNGGDLGWFRRGQMVAVFDEIAFGLKPGETSGVVESPFGLHVIRVVNKRHVDPNAFEAHRDEIEKILLNAEMQDRMPRWISGLKARARIEQRRCPETI